MSIEKTLEYRDYQFAKRMFEKYPIHPYEIFFKYIKDKNYKKGNNVDNYERLRIAQALIFGAFDVEQDLLQAEAIALDVLQSLMQFEHFNNYAYITIATACAYLGNYVKSAYYFLKAIKIQGFIKLSGYYFAFINYIISKIQYEGEALPRSGVGFSMYDPAGVINESSEKGFLQPFLALHVISSLCWNEDGEEIVAYKMPGGDLSKRVLNTCWFNDTH